MNKYEVDYFSHCQSLEEDFLEEKKKIKELFECQVPDGEFTQKEEVPGKEMAWKRSDL